MGISKKQAKVFFFRLEQLPIALDYLTNDDLVARLEICLSTAGTIAFDLVQSARLMGMVQQIPKVDENGWQKQWGGLNANASGAITAWIAHTGMERNYWASLDLPFQSMIIELAEDSDKAQVNWRAHLRRSALSAFDLAANHAGEDARAFKAVIRGESYLRNRLNKVLPQPEKEKAL